MKYTKHSNCFGLSNLRKDGARSVMLRVTCKGKRTDLYTGVNLQESQWSNKTHRVKQGCKVGETTFNILNESLDAQEKFVNDYFNEMAMLETLGAKNFRYDADGRPINQPRPPILEDGVTVYSNASILGRVTIGEGSVIGGNVWLTHSVPPHSRILQGGTQETFTNGAGI